MKTRFGCVLPPCDDKRSRPSTSSASCTRANRGHVALVAGLCLRVCWAALSNDVGAVAALKPKTASRACAETARVVQSTA
eukprot:scaffold51366_cov52-Phaeocystis_antarctica.AAC.5